MTRDRDAVVERALRGLHIPDHGQGFWEDLEARLATPTEARQSVPPWRTRVLALAAVAAAATVVVGAVALTQRPAVDDRVRTGAPSDQQTSTTSTPAPAATSTPDAVVLEWIDAVGAGDTATAAALTGPRSAAYVDALTGGAGLEGFLLEAGEGYGAWADSPDRSTTEIELGTAEGEEITVVVVSGTWTGEGGTGFRTDTIPAVRGAGGEWLVEPWAIDPATGGRIDMLSPSPADDGQFNGLAPDESLVASAPGRGGSFHFSLDDAPPTAVPAEQNDSGVRASFDPPGELASRTHLFVVVYVNDKTISTLSGTFLVEG